LLVLATFPFSPTHLSNGAAMIDRPANRYPIFSQNIHQFPVIILALVHRNCI